MGKGAFIKRMDRTVWVKKVPLSKGWIVAVRNYSTNTIMEKKKQGEGGRVKDNEFSGVK